MDIKKTALGATAGAVLLAGGALGGSLLNASAANKAQKAGAPSAKLAPNTNPAHEAAESPAHAAAEAAGRFPGGGPGAHGGKFVPNTDPAHEAAESKAHAAQEAAGQFPTAP